MDGVKDRSKVTMNRINIQENSYLSSEILMGPKYIYALEIFKTMQQNRETKIEVKELTSQDKSNSRREKLTGKVAIVTGGNSGIGRTIVETFLKEGVTVLINYIENERETEKMIYSHKSEGSLVDSFKADVTRKDQVKKMFEYVKQKYGRLDILVNNAGINIPRDFLDITEDEWDLVLNTNLKGSFLCSQEALRVMISQDSISSIINITTESGMSSISSPPKNAHYIASKLGLLGLTRILAVNFAPKVRVNAIAPGWIDTDIHNDPAERERAPYVLKQIPMGRSGRPEEVASVAVFLASDDSSYITGQTIVVGGGRVLL